MKEKTFFLNTLLAIAAGIVLLAAMLVRVFVPVASIPHPGVPELVLFSLIVLLLECYMKKSGNRCFVCVFLLSALTFALLPWMAGFCAVNEIWKAALAGGVVFTATVWVFDALQDRISSGKPGKLTPVVNAIGIYLAVQGLMGMFVI